VFDKDMNEIFVKDLKSGDLIQTDNGLEKVISVCRLDESDNMYDIQVEDENHRYYTDGILSHNSTIYCIYALWLACFHTDKRIMMLAQAESTALELLDRIKTGYEYLPSFLKPACEEWNKKNVRFANRSTIQAFASSSNGPRGQSMNCCSAWTFVTIRFKRFKWLKLKLPRWLLVLFK
jgi:hypothetical protein